MDREPPPDDHDQTPPWDEPPEEPPVPPQEPPKPPIQPLPSQFTVLPDVLVGKYASDLMVSRIAVTEKGRAESTTTVFALTFTARYQEGQTAVARVAMDRESFSRLLRFFQENCKEGGQYHDLL